MLENWLRPINIETIVETPLDSAQFGERIKRYEVEMPSLQAVRLAIVGIGEESADAVRKVLYRLSFPFGKLEAADLGNLRKDDSAFVLPLLQELMDSKICPVIIGSLPKLAQAQFKAHFACQPSVNVVAVDERVPFHPRLGEPVRLHREHCGQMSAGRGQLCHTQFAVGSPSPHLRVSKLTRERGTAVRLGVR